jgi:hypothetical protein
MLNQVAYKEASGISGVKNTCTSYTSSPTYWDLRIFVAFPHQNGHQCNLFYSATG